MEFPRGGSILEYVDEYFEVIGRPDKPEQLFYQEIQSAHRYRRPINWFKIRDIIGNYAIQESARSFSFWLLFQTVLKAFEEFKCVEENVISYILQLGYLFSIGKDEEAEAFIREKTHGVDSVLKIPHKNSVEKLMVQRYGYKYAPWHPIRSFENISTTIFDDDILNAQIKWGSVSTYLDTLVQYGVMYYPENNRHYWLKKITAMGFNVNWTADEDRPNSKSREFRDCVILNVIYYLCEMVKISTYNFDHLRALRLIFDSIPEPIVTLSEISFFITLYMKDGTSPEFSSQFCKLWKTEFPEARRSLRPRSLKHLSRCEIRRCLREAGNLPYGVESLLIPGCLRNYIVLKGR